MDAAPAFNFENLLSFALRDIAKAVSERKAETPEQKFARCQAAVHLVMGFLPRDAVEVMLAGHCVMLHEVMTADVHTSLSGETRRPVVALNKAFNETLDRLERYRQRPAEATRNAPELPPVAAVPPAPGEPAARPVAAPMNRAARRQADRAQKHAAATASRAASRLGGPKPADVTHSVSPQTADQFEATGSAQKLDDAVAKCQANPEAMTALAAGDPARFAHALGIVRPGEAFLAAAKSPGSPFDPQSDGPWQDTAIPKP
jgi:hypothetical protein